MFRLITSNILIELMLLFSIVIAPTFGFYCPTSCNCFQRTVRCIRARLTSIPKLPQDANVVNTLVWNVYVEKMSFTTYNITNLLGTNLERNYDDLSHRFRC
uniref:LRRNT domain-containing protein n=1 Tax=Glossina palpalis gambiensis TaxID=67801 RepID=A0A1B0B5J7_9MUSC